MTVITDPPQLQLSGVRCPDDWMRIRFARAGNGVRYAYRRFGDVEGIPLLLLSHFRANLDMWDPLLISEIAKQRPVIAVDNTGIGLSGGTTPDTVDAMARDIAWFLAAIGLAEVDVLGFSIGGYVAQALARLRPASVRRMILAGTAPRGTGRDAPLRGGAHAAATKDVIGLRDLLFLFFAPSAASREKGVEFIRRLGQERVDPDRSVTYEAWQAQWEAARAWVLPDTGTGAADLVQPALVAHGQFDVMVSLDRGRLLAEQLPNATWKMFPDAGHAFLFQEPEEFAADISRFLNG
jgi:pimeloyl-ACP methyl ester carboxylesterase